MMTTLSDQVSNAQPPDNAPKSAEVLVSLEELKILIRHAEADIERYPNNELFKDYLKFLRKWEQNPKSVLQSKNDIRKVSLIMAFSEGATSGLVHFGMHEILRIIFS